MLLRAGAGPSEEDASGWTSLHVAAHAGQDEVGSPCFLADGLPPVANADTSGELVSCTAFLQLV